MRYNPKYMFRYFSYHYPHTKLHVPGLHFGVESSNQTQHGWGWGDGTWDETITNPTRQVPYIALEGPYIQGYNPLETLLYSLLDTVAT